MAGWVVIRLGGIGRVGPPIAVRRFIDTAGLHVFFVEQNGVGIEIFNACRPVIRPAGGKAGSESDPFFGAGPPHGGTVVDTLVRGTFELPHPCVTDLM